MPTLTYALQIAEMIGFLSIYPLTCGINLSPDQNNVKICDSNDRKIGNSHHEVWPTICAVWSGMEKEANNDCG